MEPISNRPAPKKWEKIKKSILKILKDGDPEAPELSNIKKCEKGEGREMDTHKVNTKFGLYTFHISSGDYGLVIFGQFQDQVNYNETTKTYGNLVKAGRELGSNPHSGKWNYHTHAASLLMMRLRTIGEMHIPTENAD